MNIELWHILLGVLALLLIVLIVQQVAYALDRKKIRASERRRNNRFHEICKAASNRDVLNKLVRGGADLSQPTFRGDTALHLAYLHGDSEAVTNLVDAGAPEDQPNFERLLPHEMKALGEAVALIEAGVAQIADDGRWMQYGAQTVSRLRAMPKKRYRIALGRCLPYTPDHLGRKYALLAIKVGQPGSEKILMRLLDNFGTCDREIATDFLNAGNSTLRALAEQRAKEKNHKIIIADYQSRWALWGS